MRMRLNRAPIERLDTPVGSTILFAAEPHGFTVRAVSRDGRWVICTRPINDSDREDFEECGVGDSTIIYTVIDWDSGIRGPDNYHGLGYESPEQIARAMEIFEADDAEISVRSDAYLDIAAVTLPAASCSPETGQ